jgi:hypothetical protein
MPASAFVGEPPSIFHDLIVTNKVHDHKPINLTCSLCTRFRGVKVEEIENNDLFVRAEKAIYLLDAISMRRISTVAQRSKDCLHP